VIPLRVLMAPNVAMKVHSCDAIAVIVAPVQLSGDNDARHHDRRPERQRLSACWTAFGGRDLVMERLFSCANGTFFAVGSARRTVISRDLGVRLSRLLKKQTGPSGVCRL